MYHAISEPEQVGAPAAVESSGSSMDPTREPSGGYGATIRCPQCGYDLTGLPAPRCPECGSAYVEAVINRQRRRRRAWLLSVAVMVVVYYAPYSWLLFISEPWDQYRWLWIRFWPGLPMMLPCHLLARRLGFDLDGAPGMILMITASAAALLLFVWLGARRRWWLTIIAAAVLLLSLASSFALYGLYMI
jgi:hypothetical protein